jgi:hypothetical protein
MPDWLRHVLAAIQPLLPRAFVGQIEINVFKGGISNVNVRQSFRDDGQSEETC